MGQSTVDYEMLIAAGMKQETSRCYVAMTTFLMRLENASTKQTPFFANLDYHPIFEPRITERSSVPAAADLASRLDRLHDELRAELHNAQERQARYYNQRVSTAPTFVPDQLVWLLRRNIKTTRPTDKLDHRCLGPYPIARVLSKDVYQLRLPSYLSRLHPVFHAFLLEPYHDPSEFHPHADPDPVTLIESQPIIHSILDCRKLGQRYEYLIRWKDLPESEDSWVPLSDIPTTSTELVDRFHRRHPRSPHPHRLVIDRLAPIPEPDIIDTTDAPSPLSAQMPPAVSAPAPAVPAAAPRPRSPPAIRQNLREVYEPPSQTTTRTGRVSKPPQRYDPPLR